MDIKYISDYLTVVIGLILFIIIILGPLFLNKEHMAINKANRRERREKRVNKKKKIIDSSKNNRIQ